MNASVPPAYNPYTDCDRCQKMIGHSATLRYPDQTEVNCLLCVHCFVYYKDYMTSRMVKWFETFRETKLALGQA